MKSLTWVIQTWVIIFWQFTFAKFFNKFLKDVKNLGLVIHSFHMALTIGTKHDIVNQILVNYQHCQDYLHIASYV